MTDTSGRRLTAPPTLLSLVPDLLPKGIHNHAEGVRIILSRADLADLSLVSYQTTRAALEKAGVLGARCKVRLLLWPPGGCSRVDADVLAKPQANVEIRQIDRNTVPEMVHLKLLTLRLQDGREFVITGSANYTSNGITNHLHANSEFSVLFELDESDRTPVRTLFESLWSSGSKPLNPSDFMREMPSDEKVSTGGTVLLPFQEDALRGLEGAYSDRGRDCKGALLSLPTGAGKTVIAARFLLEHVLTSEESRVLWVAPHEELLIQGARTLNQLAPRFSRSDQLRIPDEYEVNEEHLTADFQNVEFWTLKSAHERGTYKRDYDVVLVDEAHFGASVTNKMLPALREGFPKSFFLGLTGTPYRRHFEELGDLKRIFGGIVSVDRVTVERAVNAKGEKVLSTVVPHRITDTEYAIEFDKETLSAHELGDRALREFDTPRRNLKIAQTWHKGFGRTLVFAVSVEHANNLARRFVEEHPWLRTRIQVVHSKDIPSSVPSHVHPADRRQLSRVERHLIHDLFLRGEIVVLISMNIYTMGVDFPQVETLFMARPTLSPVLYGQMVGRGLRGPAFGGTATINVVDFVDQSRTHQDLADRLMEYNSLLSFEEKQSQVLKDLQALGKRRKTLPPSNVSEETLSCPGIYRVTRPSGEPRPYRNWSWVMNIASAVRSGRREGSIQPRDMVEIILEEDGKQGERIARLLRREERPLY